MRNKENRADYQRVRQNERSLLELRQVKAPDPEDSLAKARAYLREVAAKRRRKPYVGSLVGRPGPQHRAGGL